eukprot:CAMPEP_0184647664 /NCGR_PEP_ID=MMETSP0308-20130426/4655_1 /TAXON_ID=38269 /ORGANISM="Gloeochaete witrockiana, Strain SAG 46.84" /LENGTH=235 /DNA_ID=CAMNT_0027078847 /DNA_START=109 /DNA_END=817 /DNA_ORIENTATION=+
MEEWAFDFRDLFIAAYWISKHAIGLDQRGDANERAVRGYLSRYDGERCDAVFSRAKAFFRKSCAHRARPLGLEELKSSRSRGDKVLLATGSAEFIALAAAEHFGFAEADVICTRLGRRLNNQGEEVFDGTISLSSIGGEKANRVREWAEKEGYSHADCIVYSDSMADISLFEMISSAGGAVVAVNPDPVLRKLCTKRAEWRVEDWGKSPSNKKKSFVQYALAIVIALVLYRVALV